MFLRSACHWLTGWREAEGFFLMYDPTRGYKIVSEKNPRREVATHDRVDAIRRVHGQPTMRLERGITRETVESYLPEIFEIVLGTGRRISAVCGLRYEDLDMRCTARTPHGAIVWPSDTDKMEKEWRCPISEPVREALEMAIRKRRAVGPGPLFPAPSDHTQPVRYEQASQWLREAEKLAGLKPQRGTLWHAYRRLWATSRKKLSDRDVAAAGGWSSLDALKTAYQQPDDATLLEVVEHGAELREVR